MSDGNSCYKATWVLFTLATTGAVMPPMDDMEDMDADVNPYFTARAAKGAPRYVRTTAYIRTNAPIT
jgi:hypothetical protein